MLENENTRHCHCHQEYSMNSATNMMVENNDYPNTTALSAGFEMNQQDDNCCCCAKGTAPMVPMYSYEFTNIEPEETCPEREVSREEMISQIRSLKFAIVELAEYLDTHSDDQKALCLHREYATKLHDLMDKYQKVFGPLTINFPCNKWRWLEEPWPWERGNF